MERRTLAHARGVAGRGNARAERARPRARWRVDGALRPRSSPSARVGELSSFCRHGPHPTCSSCLPPPLSPPRSLARSLAHTLAPAARSYEDIGIKPPKGVILYGEPGTGKTLLAKAVANSTSASFLRVTGSELIQKYLGEGPKLVREIFKVAEDNAPSIIFIDEIDAIGHKRRDARSSGEQEVQRTMLELLNQLDGFDERGDVKVIMATNRIEDLDPALIRPGRIDRKIEFPLPDIKTKR
jgi:hypothetical protein